ncbi:MAG: hypothetical protein LBK83_06725, partial [Treponema sp.]|nr:hypothetical protein [Treponema sp.]
DWIDVCTVNQSAWGIPGTAITDLTTFRTAARTALETATNETTRTPVANALCKEAFDTLTGFMRDFKRRYFLTPPLLPSAYISLGLKPRDSHPSPTPSPTAQVTVETYLVGRHELGVRIVYVSGSPDDKANKGYRIWYSVAAPGETPPHKPEELRKSFYTQRKKDLIEFEYGDSGSTVYFAVQVENDGKKGGWGPMVSALIP